MTTKDNGATQPDGHPDAQAIKTAKALFGFLLTRRNDNTHAVILFGSRGRGDYRLDSDLDLILVTDTQITVAYRDQLRDQAQELANMAYEQAEATPRVQLVTMETEEFCWKTEHAPESVAANAVREGTGFYRRTKASAGPSNPSSQEAKA